MLGQSKQKTYFWIKSDFRLFATNPSLYSRRKSCTKWRSSATCSQQVSKTSVRTSLKSMARLWLTCSWKQQILRLCVWCWSAVQPTSLHSSQVGNEELVLLLNEQFTCGYILCEDPCFCPWCDAASFLLFGGTTKVLMCFFFFCLVSCGETCRWLLWYLQDDSCLCRQRAWEECHNSWDWGFAGKSLPLPARVCQWSGKASRLAGWNTVILLMVWYSSLVNTKA